MQFQLLRQSISNPVVTGSEQRQQLAKAAIKERRQSICESIDDLGPASIQELMADTGFSESSISHHVLKMEKEGVLKRINGRPVRFKLDSV